MSALKVSLRGRRTLTAVLAIAVLAGVIAATAVSARKAAAPAPYVIGWVTGFTGSQATNAASATQGLQAALAYVNKNNVAGRTIKVYYADDAADPVTAGNVCNRLVNSTHVQAILGFESTPSTAACNTYLTSNNMPYILAQTSTSGSLCLANYFSLANVGNQQVNPLIKYLTKNGSKKIYIVASDFSSGHVGTAAVTAQAQADGATIVGNSYEPLGTTDFSSDISKIASAQPDTVVDILVGSDETAFYKQFKTDPRSNGIKTASFLMDDGIAASIGGALLNGTTISTGYFKDNTTKGNQQFIAAMNKKYGDKAEISGAAAAAWDGVFVLAHALKSAKSTSGPDMITALMTAKTSGPRGDLLFMNRHYVSMTTYLINEQKDGSAKLVGKFARITPIPANPTC
jgi:urea transport system substrate-binding protein